METVRQVMETVGDDKTIDVNKNAMKLLFEIRRHRCKVKDYIEATYGNFLPILTNNNLLLMEGGRLMNEIETFLESLEYNTKSKLRDASAELNSHIEDLQELLIELKAAHKVLKAEELFEKIEESKSFEKCLDTMLYLDDIKTLIDDPTDKVFHQLQCYQSIKVQYQYELELLLHGLRKQFEEMAQFTEKTFNSAKVVTIRIQKNFEKLREIVIALHKAKYNPRKLCTFLLENVFEPIIKKPTCLEQNDDDKMIEIKLSFSLAEVTDELRPNYNVVFSNMKTIFKALSYMDIPVTNSLSLFNILSDNVKEKLLSVLINECLMYSIPDTMDDMDDSTLVFDIQEFHTYLTEIKMLKESEDRALLDYAEKIGVLFEKRISTNILDVAVDIMRSDLHDMVLVVDNSQSDPHDHTIFPRCMVSKSIKSLIAFLEKITEQFTTRFKDDRSLLISTIETIVNRYLIEVPLKHEKLLLNIPQQTALFHNNCMYLAHWLRKNNVLPNATTTVLMSSIKDLGSKHFMYQINNQRSQLMEILKSFDLSDAVSELNLSTHHAIEQCLRQLDLLKNVWQTVLPEVVYTKTMSSLVNDFCQQVIRKIISIEDISSTVANELVEICGLIIKTVPGIFQDPSVTIINVKSWGKLVHLKAVLNLSLGEIAEQWADGKGPLTLSFTAQEMRHMIKALFQNTDRRANVLASIV
uniref:Putative centromere/kinetochore protein zw10 involved in mitotic chromosome segregation n=1 Tax=Tabanus bromius TaxID=304241 RepID=A0A0K8TM68_TABBR